MLKWLRYPKKHDDRADDFSKSAIVNVEYKKLVCFGVLHVQIQVKAAVKRMRGNESFFSYTIKVVLMISDVTLPVISIRLVNDDDSGRFNFLKI
jgi:hypothetical protein